MVRLLLLTILLLTGCAAPQGEFSHRKTQLFLHDAQLEKEPSGNPMIDFERQRLDFGTVSAADRTAREGHYLNFWWRAPHNASGLTARLEYRQQATGARVHVQEIAIPESRRRTVETRFKVIGAAYQKNGRIIAWRAQLLRNGAVVAETRSFLWE